MLVTFYQTSWRHISDDSDLDIHHRQNSRTHKEGFPLLLSFIHRIRKGAVFIYFEILIQHSPGGTEDNYKTFIEDSRIPRPESNPRPFEHETEMLTTGLCTLVGMFSI
jgi:hypothetical protein